MSKLVSILICFFFATQSGHAAVRAVKGFTSLGVKNIQEENVSFHYSNSDGSIELNCTHYLSDPELKDWDVWCGKGTKMFKHFRVHFLVKQYENRKAERSAFEILYWVIDRQQIQSNAFDSSSSWIQFKNLSDLELLSFSQGVENDYAFLKVELRP